MSFKSKIMAVTPLSALVIFLTVGFVWEKWEYAWLAFLLIPAMPFLLGYKKFRLSVSFVILVLYLIIGFSFDAWHPGWILFLLIPIIHILISPSKQKRINKSKTIDID